MTIDDRRPLFLSVSAYSRAINQSEGLTRKQVKSGEVRHIRSGDRVLIPRDEPYRRLAEAERSVDPDAD